MTEEKSKKKKINIKINGKLIVRALWGIFLSGIFLVFLLFLMISKGWIGYMPPVEEIENPIDKYASQVISSDAVQLGTYGYRSDNRIYVGYNDLSPALVNALIATEDVRFSQHSGVDIYALLRSIVKRGILGQESGGGGSTISQQLAKLLYSPRAGSVTERVLQKPIEWVIAVKLERYYTKEEIINMYFNKYDFNYNAIGIQNAAWLYFSKTPKTLTVDEAATLVGMCKNPTYFNPIRHNERTKGRRNEVLNLMSKHGYISTTEKDSLQKLPLVIHYNKIDHKDGLAPYFREYLRLIMTAKKPYKSDYTVDQQIKYSEDSLAWETNPLYGWCNKNKKPNGSNYNLYTDGLKVYTTVDSRMQLYAEEAITQHLSTDLQEKFFKEKKGKSYAPFERNTKPEDIQSILNRSIKQSERYQALKKQGMSEDKILASFNTPVDMTVFSWHGLKDTIMSPLDSIKYMKSFLRAGIMSMDVKTGAVKAYVGGIDYKFFQYDMVNTGRRQVGSTIKPYLYALAMEEGMRPCDYILNVPQHIQLEDGKVWSPRNSNNNRVGEMVTIKWGLQQSNNWITANLMSRLSPYAFVRLLRSFGFKDQLDPVVSLSLGVCDVSIAEMVSGYSTFANKGIRVDPVYVTRIEDNFGNTIANFTPQLYEVLSEDCAFDMLDMLRSVPDGGTASRLRYRYNIKASMGAKTGTSQNHSDGWFMAFTPSLVSGVWVGGEEPSIHFDRMAEGQAANTALPIYAYYISKVYADSTIGYSPDEQFVIPPTYKNRCYQRTYTHDNDDDIDYEYNMIFQSDGIDDIFE